MAVTVRDLQAKLRLSVIYGEDHLLDKEITTSDISRPGLEMTGCAGSVFAGPIHRCDSSAAATNCNDIEFFHTVLLSD